MKDDQALSEAIEECSSYISENQKRSRMIIMILMQLTIIVLMGIASLFMLPSLDKNSILMDSSLLTMIIPGILVLISIIIGVLVSLYRHHMLEISRTEHYKTGFMRIRIAATNTAKGFGSEVRIALTDEAFSYRYGKITTPGRVESPLPGHPTSDISTVIINKILDSIDISMKTKNDREPEKGN